MDLDEVEDIVRTAVREVGGLSVSCVRDGGYTEIRIGVPAAGDLASVADDQRVRIWTSGVEAFFLEVPGGFGYQEFDHVPHGQVEALRLLVAPAVEYLSGRVEEKSARRSCRRPRRHLEVVVGGQTHRLQHR